MTAPAFEDQARARLAGLPMLQDVEDTGRAVVFMGRYPDGQRVRLEVPRPLWLTRGVFLPVPLQPVTLTVWQGQQGEKPKGYFLFAVHEDTPQGEAVRVKLERLTL